MIPLAFAAVFIAGRSALNESEPAFIEEASTQVFEPTVEPTEEIREATLAATPEPVAPIEPASTAAAAGAPLPAELPPAPMVTEAVTPSRIEIPADRTSCSAIAGSEYRSPAERSWYLASCGRTPQPASAVARALSTPARDAVVKPTALPSAPRDLYGVSAKLCGSGVVRYPAFSDGGIAYGTCTSGIATAASALPGLGCAAGYVLIPSVLNPGALYCYAAPSTAH